MRRFKFGPRDRHYASFAVNHRVSNVRRRFPDKCNPVREFVFRPMLDPLCPRSCLSVSAPSKYQPCDPIAFREMLIRPRPEFPIIIQEVSLFRTQTLKYFVSLPLGQRGY